MLMTYSNFAKAILLPVLGVAALAVSPVSHAAKETVVPVLTCPFSCGIVATETELAAQMGRDNSSVIVAGQETPGFNYNLRSLMANKAQWRTTGIGTTSFILGMSKHGGKALVRDAFPKPLITHGKIKLIYSPFEDLAGKFFVTLDPKIKTIRDLKGKTIAIGLRKESEFGLVPQLILEAYGINTKNTTIRHVPPGAAGKMLLNGSVDAVVPLGLTNASHTLFPVVGSFQELVSAAKSSGRKLHYIGVSRKAVKAIDEKWGVDLVSLKLPAHSYPMQGHSVQVAVDRNYIAVHNGFPDKVAYQWVLGVAKAGAKLRKSGGLWSFWSPRQMVDGLTANNTQPGAIRAYKKLGWWKLRKQSTPARF